MECSNNLKQLGLACLSYETALGTLPPGTIRTDLSNGGGINATTPTWLARILPYLEQQSLYDKIDFKQLPGHEGANADLLNIPLPMARCPSDAGAKPDPAWAAGNYVACIGNHDKTLPTQGPYEGPFSVSQFTTVQEIRDGMSNTMLISECLVNHPWIKRYNGDGAGYAACLAGTEPDLTDNDTSSGGRGKTWLYGRWSQSWNYSTRLPPNDELTKNHECELWTHQGVYAARSQHPSGVLTAFGDGSAHFISDSVDLLTWRSLGTIAGGEVISGDAF